MKSFNAIILAFIFALSSAFNAFAQTSETIWITAGTTSFKTNETVLVTVNASSVTPIQGFTFQIRYDPACLKPVNATSPIPGMNGLGLPQTAGLVDASFASTTPQMANGVLAEVRFVTLGGCQTGVQLESAALAVRNESGFAAPLPGVKLGESSIAFTVDSAVAESQNSQAVSGTALPLDPGSSNPANSSTPVWGIALLTVLLIGGMGFGIYKVVQKGMGPANAETANSTPKVPAKSVVVSFKRGSYAGKSFSVDRLPCLIGRDPNNDICLTDPMVLGQHAKIYTAKNGGYYLMDLGGETYINGRPIQKSSTALKHGDVVRLGKSASFVFGV